MNAHREKPPALVLGTGLTVLGVIRSLARAGIPSVCLSQGPAFESHSRWYRFHAERVGAFAGADELGAVLERSPWPRAVLIPCSDHWAMEVTRLPEALRRRFPPAAPDTNAIVSLVDKSRLVAELERASVPHPFTARIENDARLKELLQSAPAEVFLKPVDSQRFLSRFHTKAFRVPRAEAVTYYRRARAEGFEMVLQEYVPGAADQHYFVDGYAGADHRIRAVMARRRLRMHPPDFGNSSCAVSVGLETVSAAVESLQRLLEATGYRGIFSAEFKRDARDGVYKLLEVNCRAWWYVDFSTYCGVNVVEYAWRDALGWELPPAPPPRAGMYLVYGYYDMHACRRMRREHAVTAGECLRSWLVADHPVFRWDDPAPALALFAERVAAWVRARVGGHSVSLLS